jgi:hypothetical protein
LPRNLGAIFIWRLESALEQSKQGPHAPVACNIHGWVGQVHMAYMRQPPSLLKDIHMTVNEVKPHDTSSAVTPHQHHTQAAEHLELAAKSHKAADEHVKTAHAHVAKAQEHVVAAAAKTPSLTK